MAKLSAHGTIIGTVDYTTKSLRYMSDGAILINFGQGWKIRSKIKRDSTPLQALAAARARQERFFADYPAVHRYRKMLQAMTGMKNRWKLHAAVTHMPDDPDGVWSEACDDYCNNVHADVSEVAELCLAYKAALAQNPKDVADRQ
jgi:hypothetical protein